MTRVETGIHRTFSLLIPFFFFISVHARRTAVPATPVTVEARDETSAPQHPDQYLSWKATSEQSERVDALAGDPRLAILWVGYPFSRDHSKPCRHALAVIDMRETLRTGVPKNAEDGPSPMACWSYEGPDVVRLIQKDGEDGYFHGKWARGGPEIVSDLDCADCHNTVSPRFAESKPELTLSRPYAARVMEVVGKPFERTGRFDQQSMVYGQCHAEYYFDDRNKAVKFPWDDGMKVRNMEQYYDKTTFSGWINSLSKTPMPKAQHPGYEAWTADIHGKNNVTCIDCHMSRVQNAKNKLYIDHKIGNPLDNFVQTCTNCHTQDKAALRRVVAERKQSINDLKIEAGDQLVHVHFEVRAALDAGTTGAEVKPIRDDIHHTQWHWDLAIVFHDTHIHAPKKGLRMLGTAMDKTANVRTKLTRLLATRGTTHEVQIPDISTREKTQQVTGLNMEQTKAEKQDSTRTVIPQQEEQVRKNGLLSQ